MSSRAFFQTLFGLPLLGAVSKAQARPLSTLFLEALPPGFQSYEGKRRWKGRNPGDILDIARETVYPHDTKAVAVYGQGVNLGHVPPADNRVIAVLTDQSMGLPVAIPRKRRSGNPWDRVQVRISLVITQGDYKMRPREDNA